MTALWRIGLRTKADVVKTVTDPQFTLEMGVRMSIPDNNLDDKGNIWWDRNAPSIAEAVEAGKLFSHKLAANILYGEPIVLEHDVVHRLCDSYNARYGEHVEIPKHWRLPDLTQTPLHSGLVVFERPLILTSKPEIRLHLESGNTAKLNEGHIIAGLSAFYYGTGTNKFGKILILHGFLDKDRCSWTDDNLKDIPYGSHPVLPWLWSWSSGKYDSLVMARGDEETDYHFITRFLICLLFSLWDYMEQRIDALEKPAPDKPTLKLAKKLNLAPKIQIVRWRKEESTTNPNREPGTREYSCQWSVREFTRYYKKSGKTVTVRPHWRGPKDKPKKQENIRVHVVDR